MRGLQGRPVRAAAVAGGALALAAGLLGGCGKATAGKPHAVAQTGARSASASPSPSVSSASAAPKRSKAASRGTERAAKPRVTVIGDSISVRSTPDLQQQLPGVSIDAVVGRQLSTAPGLVRQHAGALGANSVLVIELGTNGVGGTADLNAAIDAAGPKTRIVLVTIDAARSWQDPVNQQIRQVAAARHATVADWHAAISGREDLLVDGVHPGPQGQQIFASTIAGAVHKAADAG